MKKNLHVIGGQTEQNSWFKKFDSQKRASPLEILRSTKTKFVSKYASDAK